MRVLVRGMSSDVTEKMLRDKVEPHAKVVSVEIVREGDAQHPWALLDLDVDLLTGWKLVHHFDRQYFAGGITRWHVPAHQS